VVLLLFFELVWIFGFNFASLLWLWIPIVVFIFIDFHFLTKACEQLPTETVYAIFAAAGTLGTALMDVFLFGEILTFGKIGFMMVLILGVIGLQVAEGMEEKEATEGWK